MKTLIIGKGQVGQALYDVVKDHHETYIKDVEPLELEGVQVLHICYPDHDGFDKTTKSYIRHYKPSLVIINSSISVGTTEKCGSGIVYSPVRGRHPKLASDLKIYEKFVFSDSVEMMTKAYAYFTECGLKVKAHRGNTAGELLKLLSNIHMGVEIAWRQEVQRILESFEVPCYIYEEWEESYRQGYLKSGDDHLVRPSMKPDPIGGHCIIPCTEILSEQFDSDIFQFILESNEEAKEEYAANNGQLREIA